MRPRAAERLATVTVRGGRGRRQSSGGSGSAALRRANKVSVCLFRIEAARCPKSRTPSGPLAELDQRRPILKYANVPVRGWATLFARSCFRLPAASRAPQVCPLLDGCGGGDGGGLMAACWPAGSESQHAPRRPAGWPNQIKQRLIDYKQASQRDHKSGELCPARPNHEPLICLRWAERRCVRACSVC